MKEKECKHMLVFDINGKTYEFYYPKYIIEDGKLTIKESNEITIFFIERIIGFNYR